MRLARGAARACLAYVETTGPPVHSRATSSITHSPMARHSAADCSARRSAEGGASAAAAVTALPPLLPLPVGATAAAAGAAAARSARKTGDSGTNFSTARSATGESATQEISTRHHHVTVPSPPSIRTSATCAVIVERAAATPISASSLPRCSSGASSVMYSGLTVTHMPTPIPVSTRHVTSAATCGPREPPMRTAARMTLSPMTVAGRRPMARASQRPAGSQ